MTDAATKVFTGIGIVGTILGLWFLGPVLSVLGGCFSGWVVGLVWPHTTATFLARASLPVAPWQLGGMLGFVGSFFRAYVYKTKG